MRIEVVAQRTCFLSLLFALAQAGAATFYVSPHGSDSNPGTSADPFRTITYAYSHAAPGVTILVKPGTYTDYTSGWGLRLGANGTAARPIVLRSEIPGAAVIDGLNLSDRNVGLYIDGNYNIVDGFEIKNGPKGGITVWSDRNQILRCRIHNNGNVRYNSTQGQDGIYSAPDTIGNVYSGNHIYSNGRTGSRLDHGLYLCGKNELVNNNVVHANAACGLQIAGYTTVRRLRVYNNVFSFNGSNGIILWQSLNRVHIKNNILHCNGRWGIGSWDAHGSGVVVDHNLFFENGSGNFSFTDGGSDFSCRVSSARTADPLFADGSYTSFDPHLTPGSPAIRSGVNLKSVFKTDMAGAARGRSGPWDKGVYVFGQ